MHKPSLTEAHPSATHKPSLSLADLPRVASGGAPARPSDSSAPPRLGELSLRKSDVPQLRPSDVSIGPRPSDVSIGPRPSDVSLGTASLHAPGQLQVRAAFPLRALNVVSDSAPEGACEQPLEAARTPPPWPRT